MSTYTDLYEKLLWNRKNSAENVLVIGIDDERILMWHKYFNENATIHAVDIKPIESVSINPLNNQIKLYMSSDAYDPFFVAEYFNGMKFDVLLDDGPHTLRSMKQFIRLYSDKIRKGGILIIEDVQDFGWFEELEKVVPEELQRYIQYFDLRFVKGRHDDLVFAINFNET
jgi:hypothetical protein